jgi:hypothetical protein
MSLVDSAHPGKTDARCSVTRSLAEALSAGERERRSVVSTTHETECEFARVLRFDLSREWWTLFLGQAQYIVDVDRPADSLALVNAVANDAESWSFWLKLHNIGKLRSRCFVISLNQVMVGK